MRVTSSAPKKTNEVNVCHVLQVTYVTLSSRVDSCLLRVCLQHLKIVKQLQMNRNETFFFYSFPPFSSSSFQGYVLIAGSIMDLAPHLTNLSFNFSLQPLFSHNLRNSDPTKTLLYADNQREHNAASCVLFLENMLVFSKQKSCHVLASSVTFT